jgi:hypothetical protein
MSLPSIEEVGVASWTPDELPPTHPWRDVTVRQTGMRGLTLALTLVFLIPPLLLALWGGIEILRSAYAPWQWPWGVFFIGVALSPLLIALGRRGVNLGESPQDRAAR